MSAERGAERELKRAVMGARSTCSVLGRSVRRKGSISIRSASSTNSAKPSTSTYPVTQSFRAYLGRHPPVQQRPPPLNPIIHSPPLVRLARHPTGHVLLPPQPQAQESPLARGRELRQDCQPGNRGGEWGGEEEEGGSCG